MTAQATYRQILVQLQAINLHLRCLQQKLELSSLSVRRQVRQLHLIQQQLQVIQTMVFLLFGRTGTSVSDRAYLTLTELVRQSTQMAISLLLLTEESVIDPIGVQSCLRDEAIIHTQLRHRLANLTATECVC
jgi:hypothetical protein